jgi:hypothetical protein
MSNNVNKIKYVPIEDLIRLFPQWFSKDNSRSFRSKWNSYALQNGGSIHAYFVSSERHVSHFARINEPRKYTIRKFNMRDGSFSTSIDDDSIFKFQRYNTKKQAERALKEYLKTEPIKADLTEWLKRTITSLQYEQSRIHKQIGDLNTELIDVESGFSI